MLAGTYVSETGHVLRVEPRGEDLRLAFNGAEHALTPSGRFRFTIAGNPVIPRDPVTELVFTPRRGGLATSVEVRTNWYPVEFTAVGPINPASVLLADYVGTYRSDEVESSLRVFVGNGGLALEAADGRHVLEPVARDLFRAGPQIVRFTRQNGRIAAAVVSRGSLPRLAFPRTS